MLSLFAVAVIIIISIIILHVVVINDSACLGCTANR